MGVAHVDEVSLEQREQAGVEAVPVAVKLVGAVHDGGPDEVGRILRRLDVDDLPLQALLVALAAMVDPDRTARELIGWVDGGPTQMRRYRPRVPLTSLDVALAEVAAENRPWTPDSIRAAHADFVAGRDLDRPNVTLGHRLYQRARARKRRRDRAADPPGLQAVSA